MDWTCRDIALTYLNVYLITLSLHANTVRPLQKDLNFCARFYFSDDLANLTGDNLSKARGGGGGRGEGGIPSNYATLCKVVLRSTFCCTLQEHE